MKIPFVLMIPLLGCFTAAAQDEDSALVYSKVIELPGLPPEKIHSYAIRFFNNQERFFITNESVKNRKWAYGRARFWDRNIQYGLEYFDSVTNELHGHAIVAYQINGNVGCIQLMIIDADLVIKYKEAKSKMTIYNIGYTHYNTGVPPTLMKVGSGAHFCRSYGRIETLKDCESCSNTVATIKEFMEGSFLKLIAAYEASFKNSNEDDDW